MRVYLTVPYHQRHAAKAKGAHWDKTARKWYVIDRPSFRACKKWHPYELSPEIASWLNDSATDLAYTRAMDQFLQEKQAGKYDRLPRQNPAHYPGVVRPSSGQNR